MSCVFLFAVLYLLTNDMVSVITYFDQLRNPIKCIVSLSLGDKLARPIQYSNYVRDYHIFSGSSTRSCINCVRLHFSRLLISPRYKDIPTIHLQLE